MFPHAQVKELKVTTLEALKQKKTVLGNMISTSILKADHGTFGGSLHSPLDLALPALVSSFEPVRTVYTTLLELHATNSYAV